MSDICVYFEGEVIPETKKWLTVKVPLTLLFKIYYKKNTEEIEYKNISFAHNGYFTYVDDISRSRILSFIDSYYNKNPITLDEERVNILKEGKSLLGSINTIVTLVNYHEIIEGKRGDENVNLHDLNDIKKYNLAFILDTGIRASGKIIDEDYVCLFFKNDKIYTSMDHVMIL